MSISTNAIEQASHWYSKLHDLDADHPLHLEFEAWVASDASHASAFERVQSAMNVVELHSGDRVLIAMKDRALRRYVRRSQANHYRAWAIAASVLLIIGAIASWRLAAPSAAPLAPTLISTRIGETRSVTLADGSVVDLDARTRLEVSLNNMARRVHLLEGQARFQVAHDANRPFLVLVGRRAVVVKGTDFVVDRVGKEMTVTLLHGRVSVYDRQDGRNPSGRPTADLLPTDRVRGEVNGGPWSYSHVSADDAVVWQKGWMFFDDELLGSAIGQVNRYSKVQVSLDDPALGGLRVSGAFQATRPDTFCEAVADMLGLGMERRSDGSILLTRKKI